MIVTLAILSSVLAPVVVQATGRTEGPATASALVQQAKVETAAVTTSAPAAEQSGCARKVKVVYAGYGEARAACAATAETRH